MDEIDKMTLREKCKIKTKYGRNDMKEEYTKDTQKYLSEVNFKTRGRQNLVKQV